MAAGYPPQSKQSQDLYQDPEKHSAALVTSQGLHRRIIDEFDRAFKGGFEVEPHPSEPRGYAVPRPDGL